MTRRKALLALGIGLGLATASPLLQAQGGDKAVIRILVGLPAGGGTDAIARYFAEQLRAELGQPVIVENKPGAGGRLAADALAKAAPDGLTYMIAPNATPTFQTLVFGHQLRWDLWRDFAPVAGLVSYPIGLAASNALKVGNAREFVAWAKAHPAQASFGTAGMGGQTHFLGVQFAKVAGIELQPTPYKGTPPMMNDLLGGHIPAGVALIESLAPQHRAGTLRLLGIFSDKRSPLLPEVPTLAEQGYDVTLGEAWTAMWAPAKTPGAELERMQQALARILARPQVGDHLRTQLAVVPRYLDAGAMAAEQRKELAAWEPIIKASGFKPE
ncbi:tripartite tricarboxylate transporter substrate-binding protein [Thauera sinica]|uniref:Tripartite tricarboxylate transporter substrate-binding protein n=1 Tax=Thauera sinica TaxID=2665146 RepID=A0ABW1AX61_9RHOO|nr:tripartite tricarboxylate transporter substrate-binding protein [Thauera sp. K11]ATE61186.1 ABC transporter substrate-binding protein [Thauera sp. K11]